MGREIGGAGRGGGGGGMGSGPTTVAGATPTRMLRSFTCTRGMNGGGSATNALSSFWSRTLLVFFAMASDSAACSEKCIPIAFV